MDKEFFLNNRGLIKKAVDDVKKRIELRPDPEITLNEKKAEKIIRSLIPEDAKVTTILFDSQRSQVVIEAEKPGLSIGKQGSILHDIRRETLWVSYHQAYSRNPFKAYREHTGSPLSVFRIQKKVS